MVGWHHQLDGHEFEHAPGVGDGQGSLVCCLQSMESPRVRHTTEQLNDDSKNDSHIGFGARLTPAALLLNEGHFGNGALDKVTL